jgi:hypothetical protein
MVLDDTSQLYRLRMISIGGGAVLFERVAAVRQSVIMDGYEQVRSGFSGKIRAVIERDVDIFRAGHIDPGAFSFQDFFSAYL